MICLDFILIHACIALYVCLGIMCMWEQVPMEARRRLQAVTNYQM